MKLYPGTAHKLATLVSVVLLLSNTACADELPRNPPAASQPSEKQSVAEVNSSDGELPPLEALFAGHHKTLRVSTLSEGRMVAAYLAIDSQPDYLREGLISNQEVQLTHLIGLTASICQQWPGGPKSADFSVRWDLFRIPPQPKHFMGRYNISCAMAAEAYEDFGTKQSLPFLVAKHPGYIKLAVALPDLTTIRQIERWREWLATLPVATIGTLQPGEQILH